MERMLSHFGSGGNNTCLGKNVAPLEMYKVIPALLQRFHVRSPFGVMLQLSGACCTVLTARVQIQLAEPDRPWKIQLGTFVSVKGSEVRLQRREAGME